MDEESTKSDEEYLDLAMEDIQENGYWSDNDESYKDAPLPVLAKQSSDGFSTAKYKQNLDRFLRTKSDSMTDSIRKKVTSPGKVGIRRRSHSISAVGKVGSFFNGPDLSAAGQI